MNTWQKAKGFYDLEAVIKVYLLKDTKHIGLDTKKAGH